MSELLFDAVKAADLTRFARELAARTDGNLSRFLPNRQVSGTESRTTRVSRTTTKARVRAFDAETPIGKRPVSITQDKVGLAPVGQKLPLRESELIALALTEGADLAEVVQAIYDDTENNVASIINLAEAWRGQFLFTGKVSINDNGFIQEADFGLSADHNLSVGDLTAPWDGAGDAIGDELEWIRKVRAASGEDVVATIGSAKILRQLLSNPVYVEASGLAADRITPATLNAIRSEWGLPEFVVNDDEIAGARVTPEDKVALVTKSVGETQWGVTAEELELFGSNAVDSATKHQPRIVASSWKRTDPVSIWQKANATVLPVAGDINGLFVAQVLAGTTTS